MSGSGVVAAQDTAAQLIDTLRPPRIVGDYAYLLARGARAQGQQAGLLRIHRGSGALENFSLDQASGVDDIAVDETRVYSVANFRPPKLKIHDLTGRLLATHELPIDMVGSLESDPTHLYFFTSGETEQLLPSDTKLVVIAKSNPAKIERVVPIPGLDAEVFNCARLGSRLYFAAGVRGELDDNRVGWVDLSSFEVGYVKLKNDLPFQLATSGSRVITAHGFLNPSRTPPPRLTGVSADGAEYASIPLPTPVVNLAADSRRVLILDRGHQSSTITYRSFRAADPDKLETAVIPDEGGFFPAAVVPLGIP